MNRKKQLPLAIDTFCGFSFLSNIAFSPKGESAAFTLTRANVKENRYDSWIWLRKNGKNSRLTGLGRESRFVWLDEETIAFPANRDPDEKESIDTKYYKIRIDGGEAELFLTFPIPVTQILPVENGDFVVSGTVFPGWEDLYEGKKKRLAAYLKDKKDNEDYEVSTQLPFWWNGGSFTKGSYTTLYRWDHRKQKLYPLLPKWTAVSNIRRKEGDDFVYFIAHDAKRPWLKMTGESYLARVNLKSGEMQKLVESGPSLEIYTYELAEHFLLLAASDLSLGINTDPDFYKVDYETGECTLYAKWGRAIGTSVGTDVRYGGGYSARIAGDTLYFVTTLWDSAYLYKLEDGIVSPVVRKDGSADFFDLCEDKILLCGLYDMKPQELYEVKESGPEAGRLRKVSSFNEAVLKGRYVAQPEPLIFERLGRPVHGFVLKPAGFDPAKKYPCILDVHGGPKTVYGPVYYHEMQYWAGKGYFVIFCNPQGSDGRGEFMDIRGKYGSVDFDDIMAFTDEALKAYPEINPEELFETGGSYGGYMTNWIIGHTDRFRACASQRSISNWISFFGTSDIGPDFDEDQTGCSPWEDPEKLWSQSPMAFADKVRTPTLFIHSFEDYRCPIEQAYQMYASLLAHGVESKIVAFRGENHELSRSGKPKHRIRRLKEITEWFDTHRTCSTI